MEFASDVAVLLCYSPVAQCHFLKKKYIFCMIVWEMQPPLRNLDSYAICNRVCVKQN